MNDSVGISRHPIGWRHILQILSVSFLKELWPLLELKVEEKHSARIIETARSSYLALFDYFSEDIIGKNTNIDIQNVISNFLLSIRNQCGAECQIDIESWGDSLSQITNEIKISHRVICNFFNLSNNNCNDICMEGISGNLSGKIINIFKNDFEGVYQNLSIKIDSLKEGKKSKEDYNILELCETPPVSSAMNTLLCVREIILEKYTYSFWNKLKASLSNSEYKALINWYKCENHQRGILGDFIY